MKCIRGESSQDSASSTLRKIEERICNPRTKHIHPVVAGTGAHGQFPRSPASMILLFYFQPCSWSRRARFSTPSTSPRKQRGKVFLGRWKRNGRGEGGERGKGKGRRRGGPMDEEGRIWCPPPPQSFLLEQGVGIYACPPELWPFYLISWPIDKHRW